MKKLILLLLTSTLLCITSRAQSVKEDLDIIQSVFQKSKSALIRENLKLSETQSKGFWQIYDFYESKRLILSRERGKILVDYLNSYDTLTGQEAIALVNRTLSNDQAFSKLEKSYLKKFADVIGGKNVAKFYQLENYLQQTVRIRTQDNIPFIDELQN